MRILQGDVSSSPVRTTAWRWVILLPESEELASGQDNSQPVEEFFMTRNGTIQNTCKDANSC